MVTKIEDDFVKRPVTGLGRLQHMHDKSNDSSVRGCVQVTSVEQSESIK